MNGPIRLQEVWTILFSRMMLLTVALTFVLASNSALGVGLTYVDADDFLPNVAPLSAIHPASNVNDDSLWGFRGNFGANSTIYESGVAEDSPELTQTVTGLTPNTNYDVYGVFWTNPNENWMLQVGTMPGNLTLYNWRGPDATGAFQNAIAGTLASAANWDAPPMANGIPIYSQGTNLVMLLGYGGSAMSNGLGDLEVFVDDLQASGGRRTWFDGVAYVPAGTPVLLEASIDRDSGLLTVNNPTEIDFQFKSYEVVSAAGSLDASEWSTISGGSFDVDPWSITAPADPQNTVFATELVEAEDVGASIPGATLSSGGGSLNLGNVWQKTPFQDVLVRLTLLDDSVVTLSPTYSGSAILPGDFDAIDDISVNDYEIMMSNMFSDLSALTLAEAFTHGDMTGDRVVDFVDHRRFQLAYDAFHGEGAFANMTAAVPEPGALALALIALSIGIVSRIGKQQLLCIAGLAAFCAAPGFAGATPVTDWLVDPLVAGSNPVITNPETNSPTIGDGSQFNADAVAFYAPASLVELADGEQAVLSGTIELIGVIGSDLRWGLFKDDGVAPDTAGWRGFMAVNSNGANPGIIFSKNSANANFATVTFASISTGTTIGGTRGDLDLPISEDTYDFTMTVERFGNENEVRATLVSTTGDYIFRTDSFRDADPARTLFEFDRVGVLSGGAMDADQIVLGNVDVSKSNVVAPTLVVESDGGVSIVNHANQSFDLAFYEISSDSGSLDVGGWTSLDSGEGGDPFGEGWDEAGGSSATRLGEGNFASSTTLAMEGSLDLGSAFTMGGTQDLVFRYATTDGILLRGFVEYEFAPSIDGDHNGDGTVNAADYVFWRDTMSDEIGGYNDWRANFGASAGSGASTNAVPEPGVFALLAITAMAVGISRLRRSPTRGHF